MKNSQSRKRKNSRKQPKLTIGIDLGDKTSRYCVLGEEGEITKEASVRTKRQELVSTLGAWSGSALPWKWDPLAVGEPTAGQPGTRGDRGQRAATAAEHVQQPQVRSAGRTNAGADGARGPTAVAAHPAP